MVDSPSHPSTYPTRTVAIIKPHALPHRLDIERRITEAGFEIAKERQMMFRENDRDVEELFGANNARSLAGNPCWVYVLERRRAVEVLKTLMGDEDPEVARQSNANSLRALYGVNVTNNAIFGSPDTTTAEHQISILFASSPPFRATELPESPSIQSQSGSLRSITSSILDALNQEHGDDSASRNSAPSISSRATSIAGKSSGFRARPIPATTSEPSIQPRLSRAAALRQGLIEPKVTIWHDGPRQPISKEEHLRTFANVPGHKRAESIAVASTAPPTIAPRMTRAASLRQGIKDASPSKSRVRNPEAEKKTFEGVPGHKRRETLTVASVQAPTVAPRLNKAAALRAERDKSPPTSFMFRGSSASKAPSGLTSRPSTSSGRPSSSLGPHPSSEAGHTRAASATPGAGPKGPPPASIRPPSIEPRQNKSALLRAKKLEAAEKANGKINGRPVFV